MATNLPKQKLGRILFEYRQNRGWTLKTLSEATGVSTSVLSKVENDQAGISFETAMKIIGALDLTLDDLKREGGSQAPPRGRRLFNAAGTALNVPSLGCRYEFFATELRRRMMSPMIMTVEARSLEEWGPLSRHEGEEWMYILSGRVELHTEFYSALIMQTGDSIYIDSEMGHAFVALGDEEVKVLAVCTGERMSADL
jgi:transcriptional regulator with XRE-family HTH domain